jgi:hypothetical protein
MSSKARNLKTFEQRKQTKKVKVKVTYINETEHTISILFKTAKVRILLLK